MDSDSPVADSATQRLRHARHSLLSLHKALMEDQREAYERSHGRIDSSYKFLDLLMNDPWFDWLHRLSELVVQIDEMLEAEEAPAEQDAKSLINQARVLLIPAENGSEFQRKYSTALQASPSVVLAHAEVVKLLGKPPRDANAD